MLPIAIVLFGARVAIGDAPPTKLVYERGPGAESCPDEAAMRVEVAARLGRDPFVDQGARTVVVKIKREAGTFRGTIELLDAKGAPAGTRTLSSASNDCKELASALSLAMAIA
ncbi:MAG: hypothetical protein ACXWVM_17645, partial [Polyangiales bacterium]